MASLSWMIDIINKETSKTILNALQSVSKSSVKKIQDKRSDIINNWFGGFNGSEFAATKVQHVQSSFSVSGLIGSLSFNTWTESSEISEFPTADRWAMKYGEGSYSSNEYVSNLIFDQGIIGLPAKSRIPNYNGTGWSNGQNLHFYQKSPLRFALSDDSNWEGLYNEILNDIESKIN